MEGDTAVHHHIPSLTRYNGRGGHLSKGLTSGAPAEVSLRAIVHKVGVRFPVVVVVSQNVLWPARPLVGSRRPVDTSD